MRRVGFYGWSSRLALVGFCTLALSACEPAFTAAVVLTLEGSVAPVGGVYRVEVRQLDGTPFDGLEPQVSTAVSGAQEVTVLLENATLFTGSEASVVLWVHALSQPGAGALAVGLGTASIELEKGEVLRQTLSLASDPRPFRGAIMARVASSAGTFNGRRIAVAAAADSELSALPSAEFTLLLWLEADGQFARLGEFSGAASTFDADNSPADRFIDKQPLRVLMTLELAGHAGQLNHPLGWTVFQGSLAAATQEALQGALGQDGSLLRLLNLVQHAKTHAGFAEESAAVSSSVGVRLHSEHIFNILVAADLQADLDDDGVADLPHGIDPAGVGVYRAQAAAVAETVAESLPDVAFPPNPPFGSRGAIYAAAQACAATFNAVVDDALATATQNATGHQGAIELALVHEQVAMTDDLLGVPFGAADGVLSALCLYERIEALSAFVLSPAPQGLPQ